jgi:heat shock protein HtpX
MDNLFSTHPATENRIRALEQLAGAMSSAPRAAVETASPGPWSRAGARRPAGPWG